MTDFLDSTGFSPKRFQDVKASLDVNLSNNLDQAIDTSANSVIGQLESIFAIEVSRMWEIQEAIYNAFQIERAEGKQLEDLVLLGGVLRENASYTYGQCIFGGRNNTFIPIGSKVATLAGDVLDVLTTININNNACNSIGLQLNSVVEGFTYSISIGASFYEYTPQIGSGDDVDKVLLELSTLINDAGAAYGAVVNENDILISHNTIIGVLSVNYSSYFEVQEVKSFGDVQAVEEGKIYAAAKSVVNIVTAVSGWESVDNYAALNIGQDEETDYSLRQRYFETLAGSAAATPDAISAAITNVVNVTDTVLLENDSMVVDVNGLPPKSFEIVVQGGEDQDIADELWRVKPAGIEDYGTESINVSDFYKNLQTVHFSRPDTKYATVQVDYVLDPESPTPTDLEDAIETAVLDYGNSLGIGEDILTQKIITSIFVAVPQGLWSVDVTTGVEDTPIVSTNLDATNKTIDYREATEFSTTRIIVGEV